MKIKLGKFIILPFLCFVVFTACNRAENTGMDTDESDSNVAQDQDGWGDNSDIKQTEDQIPEPQIDIDNVNIYFEYSGSMDGYIKNISNLKATLVELATNIPNTTTGRKLPHLYIISNNDVQHKVVTNELTYKTVADIGNKLQPGSSTGAFKNAQNTRLNEIVGKVLQDHKENEISILISDFIYSVIGVANGDKPVLDIVSNDTRHRLNQKLSEQGFEDFSVDFYKTTSEFNGIYYDKNNQRYSYSSESNNAKRPIYFLVMGKEKLLKKFIKGAKIEEIMKVKETGDAEKVLKHIELYPSSSSSNVEKDVNFSVICEGGEFELDAQGNLTKNIADFELISDEDRHHLLKSYQKDPGLAVAARVDANPFLDENKNKEYIKAPANYAVENGEIISINDYSSKKNELEKKSCAFDLDLKTDVKRPNYMFIVKVSESADLNSPLKISLKKPVKTELPEWVKASSNDDDTQGPDDKTTFGLEYFVKGLAGAYEPKSEYLFTMEIPFKNKDSGCSSVIIW